VKIRFFGKEVALIVCFVLLFSAFTFAAEDKVMKIQGKVMSLDVAKKKVVVNEKTFIWDLNSIFYDEKGSPIPITADRLTKGTGVSIEATWIKNKPYIIKKLSLLPPK
jgi:hypothetical protein